DVRVLFDGDDESGLWNPNGIALDPEERFLYVGISSYKNRKRSGIYCFSLMPDGSIDLTSGRDKPRIPIKGPDGIAVHRNGDIYFTAGGKVEVYDRYGRRRGSIKLPGGSGTNLCFSPERPFNQLFITTWNALYTVTVE
ncbi:MAG: SMP-30/gluconolactonase/LRE family protein, partial [Verrucomicrobiota bacterium]